MRLLLWSHGGMGTVVNASEPTMVWLAQRALSVRHRPGAPGAEPAVMIHGLGGSSLNWTDLMVGLSDRLDSSAVDLAGFGESPPPRDGDFSPLGQARGIADLIQEKYSEPVHLFGNSLGGAVAAGAGGEGEGEEKKDEKAKKPKAGDASAEEQQTAAQLKSRALLPIKKAPFKLETVAITADMKAAKAYSKLRIERVNAKYVGIRAKRAADGDKKEAES